MPANLNMPRDGGPHAAGGAELAALLRWIAAARLSITMTEFVVWSPGRDVRVHAHDDLYHLDLFDGLGSYTLGSERFAFADCTILLIPPGLPHSFGASPVGKLRSLGIKFKAEGSDAGKLPPIHLQPPAEGLRRRTEGSLRRIIEERHLAGPGSELIVSATLLAMLADVLRAWSSQQPGTAGRGVVQDACRYLAVHYSEPITIAELARKCGTRSDSLCRLFGAHVGISPRAYLGRCRLRQACLLLQSGHTATEAAEQSGFSSVHYFSRAFKKALGRPPAAWRASQDHG